MKRRTFIVIIAGVLASVVGGYLVLHQEKQEAPKIAVQAERPIPVSIVAVAAATVSDTLNLVGEIQAIREADIVAEVEGQVRRIAVEPGERKEKGALLVALDDEVAAARKKKAELHYRQAARTAERYSALYRDGAVSLSAYEAMELQREEAQAELVSATKHMQNAAIRAPFGGVVTSRLVSEGELVRVGTKVAHMADFSRTKVVLYAPERTLPLFVLGKSVLVSSNLFPDKRFSGKVSAISDRAERAHNYRIEVLLNNESRSIPFRSGMFARVLVPSEGERQALVVPRRALVNGMRNPAIFVVRNGRAWFTPIIAGMEMPREFEVLGGLVAGDSVIVSGQQELRDKARVEVVHR
uniref:Secretion protein HlyD n=1 Tax=Chlorobium chlorochromatii (strain CaD3) TaxID=340177 RepID=Q3ARZ0_CHLCH